LLSGIHLKFFHIVVILLLVQQGRCSYAGRGMW
jgi:hypothetical protein